MRFIARTDGLTDQGEYESCAQHLMMTGVLTGAFCKSFGLLHSGLVAGLCHDLGKYSPQFQDMIRGKNSRVDHSTIGAQLAEQKRLLLASFAIMSHHSGLPDQGNRASEPENSDYMGRLKRNAETRPPVPSIDSDSDKIEERVSAALAALTEKAQTEERECIQPDGAVRPDAFRVMFSERLLFSALVDADRLDAEYFTRGENDEEGRSNPRPEWPLLKELTMRVRRQLDNREIINRSDAETAKELAEQFSQQQHKEQEGQLAHLSQIQLAFDKQLMEAGRSTPVITKRNELLKSCLSHAQDDPGFFRLTAPTGSGKTNASVSFALRHAVLHHKRRVIYVIPYMSIIDQTVRSLERLFPDEAVLPHYSEASYWLKEDDERTALDVRRANATENWDSPIIVTTAVQFFESLFSNNPARCRKLHNIADSVVIFDEAQTIPTDYLLPCLRAMDLLVREAGCSLLLSTATQPAIDPLISDLWRQDDENPMPFREIAPQGLTENPVFRRVVFEEKNMAEQGEGSFSDQIAASHQVLAVVNTRAEATTLYKDIKSRAEDTDSVFCLTTLLVPHDRRCRLTQIRERLADDRPCRVISTSLIEAGVDLDFPRVYREQAGLDSILQAAGRCNREGRRPSSESRVTIIENPEQSVPQYIFQNVSAFHTVRGRYPQDALDSQELIRRYFSELFDLKGQETLDSKSILKIRLCDFATVARRFHLIEEDTQTVYVPVDETSRQLCDKLREEQWLTSAEYRRLGPYSVELFDKSVKSLLTVGALEQIGDDYVVTDRSCYSSDTGLLLHGADPSGLFV